MTTDNDRDLQRLAWRTEWANGVCGREIHFTPRAGLGCNPFPWLFVGPKLFSENI